MSLLMDDRTRSSDYLFGDVQHSTVGAVKRTEKPYQTTFLRRMRNIRDTALFPLKKRLVSVLDFCLLEILVLIGVIVFTAAYFYFGVSASEWQDAIQGNAKSLSKKIGQFSHYIIGALFIPLPRRNIVSAMLGCSFERAIKYHRWLGNTLFFVIIIHVALMATYWVTTKQFESQFDGNLLATVKYELTKTANIYAEIAFGCLFFLFLLSAEPIRRKFFEVFYKPHVVLFGPFLVFATLHEKWEHLLVILSIPFSFYVIDILIRMFMYVKNGKVQLVSATPVSNKYVRLRFRTKMFINPGQYIFIYLPRMALFQIHPFSVSGTEVDEEGNTVASIHVKVEGAWSKRVYRHFIDFPEKTESTIMLIEGPYGNLSIPPLESFTGLLYVAGGIGITPFIPHMKAVLQKRQRFNNLEKLTLVWAVRDTDLLQDFEEDFEQLLDDSRVRVRVFITRTVATTPEEEEDVTSTFDGKDDIWSTAQSQLSDLGCVFTPDERIEMETGRPFIKKEVLDFIEDVDSVRRGGDVAAMACGPNAMMQQCGRACGGLTGRVAFHTETFCL